MNLGKLQETVKDREALCASVHGVIKLGHVLVTEQKQVYHSFLSQEKVSFKFKTSVTIHGDFGDQENKVCHCFLGRNILWHCPSLGLELKTDLFQSCGHY